MTASMPLPAHLAPISVEIPATWSDEQALAVFELLDELKDRIWARYGCRLQEQILYQRNQLPGTTDHDDDAR
jgi:hypothetical protein